MHVSWVFTGDGLLTLLGGALALLGVWWANHQSVSNLREQLGVDSKSRAADRERKKRSVATGILFEIDSTYAFYIRDLYEALKDKDPATCKLPGMKSVGTQPFPVYYGNTGSLGLLPEELARAIVGSYSIADAYLCTLRDYKTEADHWYERVDPMSEEKARPLLKQIKAAGPELTKHTFLVCSKLCEATGVKFNAPMIPVAGQHLSVSSIEASLKPTNAKA